jgi:hypothetical protein
VSVGWALLVRLGHGDVGTWPVGRGRGEGVGLGAGTADGGCGAGGVVVGAAQGPGPPLRLPGRCASLARLPVRAALDPGDLCGPWGQVVRAGWGLPRARAA